MTRLGGPPEQYLRECSNTSLRYFEMSKLEHVANLRRELSVLLEEMMQESALALFARWMLEKRSVPGGSPGNGSATKMAESRGARSLMEEFIKEANPAAGFSATAHGGHGAGAEFHEGEAGTRGHAAPRRSVGRPERRPDRRCVRGPRGAGRAGDETH